MDEAEQTRPRARISASAPRRGFGYVVLFGLGALLLYLSVVSLSGALGRVALLAGGVGAIWFAETMRRATGVELILTETALIESSGRVLANLDEVVSVERGALALKPSNGFTLVLQSRQPRAWAPGMWWRLGRRVGVGGVTSAGAAKFMAEQIAFQIAARNP